MTTSVSKISNAGNLYEDPTQRLQKGLDDYTKLLEKEKRYHPSTGTASFSMNNAKKKTIKSRK
jgi:hypothetical protein